MIRVNRFTHSTDLTCEFTDQSRVTRQPIVVGQRLVQSLKKIVGKIGSIYKSDHFIMELCHEYKLYNRINKTSYNNL